MTHKMIKLTCMALLPALLLILLPARATLAVDLDNIATFEDLQDAIADYETADVDMTITVTENIIITDTLIIPNTGHTLTITSDGGPHKLTRNITGNLFSVVTNANLKLQNITIDGNNSNITNANGSLVFVGGGSFTMENNTTLQNNTTLFGGGVLVSGGSFTMNGGTISNNIASNGGGGVYFYIGSFTMNGGTIKNNSATSNGGGVLVDGVTFTMSGGAKISSNTAQTGGGVYVFGGGSFTMKGTAEISGNTANFGGGGVYVFGGSFDTLGGTAKITGNTLTGDTTPNNLDLSSGWPIMLDTSEDAPASGMEIGVTVPVPREGQTIVPIGAEEESAEYFSYDSSGWYVVHQSGALVLTTTNPNFTITFDSDGGTPTTQTLTTNKSGKLASLPADPSRAGYTFKGWYTAQDGGDKIEISHNFAADTTLYARWQEIIITYTVSFNSNGGNSVTSQDIISGEAAAKPTNPTRTGFTFKGWYSDVALITAYDFSTPVTAGITLYAKWQQQTDPPTPIVKHTVTFNTNGGNSVASQNIISGEAAAKPTNPTRTGYTFAGWYSDAALITAYDFSTPVTAGITLYAKWQQQTDPPTPIVKHAVTFNTNGGNSVASQTVEDGQTAIKPTNPTRAGYTFAGWYSNIGLTTAYNFDTPVTADITLHAKWSSNSTGNDKDKDKDSGSTPPTTPTQPTPPGPDLGGGKLTTPPDQPPVTDKNGNTNLPGGGQITTPGGTMLDLPPNTTINKSGQITVGRGGATANRNALTLRIPENMEIIMDINVPLGFYITVFNPFVDVRQDDWFFSQVIFAYNHGLMIGTSTEPMLFSPNAPLTRAMLVNILYRLAGEPATTGLPIPYTDVEEGKWYTNAIKWAAANNIAQGIGGDTFAPDAGIPREQIAVVIDNFLAHMGYTLPQINPAQAYGDAASISTWAADSITLMQQTGLMTGQPDNTFNPQGLTTRAEAATMLKRLIEAIVK